MSAFQIEEKRVQLLRILPLLVDRSEMSHQFFQILRVLSHDLDHDVV